MAMKKQITFEGLTYNLDNRDRVAAQVALKETGVSTTYKRNYESLTSATKTVTVAESGTVFGFNRAGGVAVTLPTPAAGLHYTFIIETTFTTAGSITTATSDGTDGFVGFLTHHDPATASDTNTFIPAASNDSIDFGEIEQGWLAGGVVKLTGLNTTTWFVEGNLIGDATLATAFQDAP